jgi:hypothetical protein
MKLPKKEIVQILTYKAISVTLFVTTGLAASALGSAFQLNLYLIVALVIGLSGATVVDFVQSKGALDMSKYSNRQALEMGSAMSIGFIGSYSLFQMI